MSKLSRTVLKGIIKECMVEIMQESFFPHSNSQIQEMFNESKSQILDRQKYKKNAQQKHTSKNRSRHLDNISYNKKYSEEGKVSDHFEKKVNNLASNMTSDPILADIFKDTAMTTLQEQVSADNKNPKIAMMSTRSIDKAAMTVSQNDPTDIFGAEAAGKWATLAFADNVKK